MHLAEFTLKIQKNIVSFSNQTNYSYEKAINPLLNPSMHLEEELRHISAACENPNAFQPIYEKYYNPIFRFIHRRTSDEMLSADLCSQVFLKALTKLSQYEYRGLPFSSWLYRIAANEINMHYRQHKKRRTVSLETEQIAGFFEENDGDELKEKIEKLKKVMQTLPQQAMQLIELRFFEKRPFKEIGEIMGITENNAKVKTYRLLDSMKKDMIRQNFGDR